jgi:hypothetical protein
MAKKPLLNATKLADEAKADLYKMISDWHALATQVADLSAKEMEARKAIADKYFKDAEEGTNVIVLDFGKELKLDKRVTRKLDKAELEAATAASTNWAALNPDKTEWPADLIPLEILSGLISYDPKLSVGTWKGLDQTTRLKLGNIVSEADGSPGLTIHTPKKS